MEDNHNNNRINNYNNYIIIIIIICLIGLSITSIIMMRNNINLIVKEYSQMEINSFKRKSFYKRFFELYADFNCLICFLNIIILIVYNTNLNYIINPFNKIKQTFIYFNYLFFGPFLFGVVILGMNYGNEITFIYDEKKKVNISLDYINIMIIFIYIFVSFTIGIIGPLYYTFTYFSDSIKFKRYGNYLLGKIFWYFICKNPSGIRIIIDNNNRENQNNQEIQNVILPFDDEFLLDNMFEE